MVEMRWVERTVPAPEFGENIGCTVKVLQSRSWSGSRIVQTPDAARFTYEQGDWSDWRDIPTVTEGAS